MNPLLLSNLPAIYDILFNFAQSDGFWANWQTAFGTSYDVVKATQLRQQWQSRDFGQIPPIEVLSDEVLGTANGAYSSSTNKIYLSASFLNTASSATIINVILEEIGHYVDAQINQVDSAGDEGAIFAELVRGNSLDVATLDALRAENDQTIIIVNGEIIQVEQANFTGTNGNDNITGTSEDDNISGLDGNDTLSGLGGNDNIYGGNGNDSLNGDTGDDYFTNDAGNDTINGGSGFDRYDANYSNASSGLTMTYDSATGSGTITVGTETDTFTSIESFEGFKGTEYNDVIFGGTASEYWGALSGGSGNDTISGNAGDDQIYGEDGNDVLNGGADNDELYGGNGNDTLQGTNGGTGEQDYLEGGTGSDRFILADTTKTFYDDGNSTLPGDYDYATIADFNTTDDIIQLRGSSGDYLLSVSGSNTNLYINKPGSEPDELIAVINNQTALSLTASYFSYVSSPTLPSITLAVSPSSVTEDGTTNLVYTFTRTGITTNALTVSYGITGTADSTDYTGATPGTGKTITFATGSSTATLTIDPTADTTVEPDETVALTLATGTGYTVGTNAAVTGTITNDDLPTITLAVSPSSVTEDGTTNLVYTFTRTGATTSALTVNYSIAGTADATDYTGATPGTGKTITFVAGSATATLTIDPTADTTIEANETVALTLATGTGYTIGTTTAVTGTITNDDLPSITLAVAPASVTEDGTGNLVYTFSRTGATTSALTVNYSIAGTADATDYTGATPGTGKTITFAAGSATATLTIDPTADTTIEANETVALTLATGTGYTIGTTTAVTGTITDDDLPSITLGLNFSGISENSPSNFVYTFTRTGATTNALTVNYGIAGTALSTDYTGATPGPGKTITFAAGSSNATLTLDPTADTTIEPNETISLQLVAGTGYNIGTTAAQIATIINDDGTRRHVGTNGNDVLLGTTANDYLIGGAGDDNLTGGAGGDLFSFATANLGNDRIMDFDPGQDTILVSAAGFGGGLIAGDTITAAQFFLGSTATNASQRFIYNSTNGALWFDVDGNGSQVGKQIATLNTGLALTFEDIFVS
ncbi:MAG: Calx-beta domain-containing protein [Dolichospermum sp.]